MFSRTKEDLIGKKADLSVGEPWDFVSSVGRGKLEGVISAVSDVAAPRQWVLMDVNTFEYQGKEIKQLFGKNRYGVKDQDVFLNLLRGKCVVLNLHFFKDGRKASPEEYLELSNKKNEEMSFLIGGIDKVYW